MMMSQILKSAGFTKHTNLDISRTKYFFLQKKQFINYTSRAALSQRTLL